ncbi:histidine phosphatase family protein [Anaerococcus sp.]|uniref:histidine phosphatase family protein n=1 Tax=Anaerococcus sp. TaxID=1872515 RepID=UPI0028FF35E8|nr:histidine phosphatase family protein [Anaerococcus sp.]MDU1828957.1 histidine phosphatase family protein [Anaerococcus sp.]MDU1864716.1 histidine phosphatase family protein [Anaerococcus sp.]
MKIILVRHGVSAANITKQDSASDVFNNKSGFNVLLKTRRSLEKFNIDHVYSSSLKEAKQTADMLGFKDYTVDERLDELDLGPYKGELYEQFQSKYAEFLDQHTDDAASIKFPGDESREDLIKRTSEFLDELVEKGEDALCVSHNLTIRAALFWILEYTKNFDNFWIENGAVTVFDIKDGKKLIESINVL